MLLLPVKYTWSTQLLWSGLNSWKYATIDKHHRSCLWDEELRTNSHFETISLKTSLLTQYHTIPLTYTSLHFNSIQNSLYLGINCTYNTGMHPHCCGEGYMNCLLRGQHLTGCYDNHTDNIHISLPRICIISFILSILYQQSGKHMTKSMTNLTQD